MSKPKIRFNGFTEDWEQRKVKDVAPLQRGFDLPTSQMEEGIYPVVMSNGIGGHHSQYKVKGPGIVTGRSGTIGKLHYIEDDYWPHNTTLWVTDFYDNNQKFIYYMYQCLDLSRFSTGSGVPTLNRNDIHDEVVCIPSVSEQKEISDYLTTLDHLITLHQRKCEETKKLKKCMLQKMFPKNGECVPEIRFSGFTDAWEQRKLIDISEIVTGTTPPTRNKDNYGGTKLFVSPADIQGNRYIDDTITTLTEKGFALGRKLRPGASLFVSIGSTIGKVAQIKDFVVTNQQINAVIPFEFMDDDYVFSMLEKEADRVKKMSAQQAVPIVNKTTFGDLEIMYPSRGEQVKIGEYFNHLDHFITLHQRKCDELKSFKKFMLQNMFL